MTVDAIDVRRLRAFQLVARNGNLRAAAESLGQTIPAISAKIKRLEKEIGVKLFERLSNKLVLTGGGEVFVREVEGFLDAAEQILASCSPAKLAGSLTIGIGSDHDRYFVSDISRFITKNPFVDVSMEVCRSAEAIPALQRGQIDLAVGVFPQLPPRVERHEICDAPISLVCDRHHPLARTASPTLADIAKNRLIVTRKHSETRRVVEAAFARYHIVPNKLIEVGNCGTATLFAKEKMGVAVIHSLATEEASSDLVTSIDVGRLFEKVRFSAIYRSGAKKSSSIRAFLDELDLSQNGTRNAAKKSHIEAA